VASGPITPSSRSHGRPVRSAQRHTLNQEPRRTVRPRAGYTRDDLGRRAIPQADDGTGLWQPCRTSGRTLTCGYELRRTDRTHGTDLRIRRLGVRVPPSAPMLSTPGGRASYASSCSSSSSSGRIFGHIVGGVGHPGRFASAYSPKVMRPCAGSNLGPWARRRPRPRPQTDKRLRPHAD
jgi:hypothetical protein